MPTLYWGPWLAKIRRGGPALSYCGLVDAKIRASDKGIRVLEACLDYSNHHTRICEFEFLFSCQQLSHQKRSTDL